MKRIVVLGSTGSVGKQALDLARRHPDLLHVVGLTAGRNVELLSEQLAEFRPEVFAVADPEAGDRLLSLHPDWKPTCAGFGPDALCRVAEAGADVVLNALLGYAGLGPSLAVLGNGTDLALANKESMVVAGELLRRRALESGARILPVDSEHSAVAQCLRAGRLTEVQRIILTASGGPFRTRSRADLETVTRAEALRHPTWTMGPKITIDSATLMNKGLEVIEAHWLFDIDLDRIDIVVHPQSIVHSMVEFVDGSIVAQLGTTDMRVPVWIALHDPDRRDADLERLDLVRAGSLTFEPLDAERFPCVGLAVEAGRRAGVYPAALNAANEVAVAAFLEDRLRFLEIPEVIEAALERVENEPRQVGLDLETIRQTDSQTRRFALDFVERRCAAGGRAC